MPKSASLEEIAASLTVKLKRHQLTSEDMAEFVSYIQEQKELNPEVSVSLQDYVKEKFYQGQDNIVVVPDFSGVIIGETVEHDVEALRGAFEVDNAAGMSEPSQEHEENFLKNIKSVLANKRDKNLDLSGVDFTGCLMEGAVFKSCNLTGVDARDADLSGLVLDDCITKDMDFRGADISGLKFKELGVTDVLYEGDIAIKPVSVSALLVHDNDQRYNNMRFSTSESMLHRYREDNDRLEDEAKEDFEQRKEEDLSDKREELAAAEKLVNDAYQKVSNYQLIWSGGVEYDAYIDVQKEKSSEISRLKKEIAAISEQGFNQVEKEKIKYVVHPSVIENLLLVSDSVRNKYDPAYERGSSKEQAQGKIQYVRLTREDAEKYLKACADKPDLSINDFAKEQMGSKGVDEVAGARVVADFSIYIDENDEHALYAGITTDLSGLNFSGRDLEGACFVGADVQDCDFSRAKLNFATFEGADASRANFTGASARDANFKAAKIQSAIIKAGDFTRAYMPYVRVHDLDRDEVSAEAGKPLTISDDSRFDYADLSHASLGRAKIKDSSFDYADLSGVSLAGADIQRCKMRHANLEKAILKNCTMVETDLSGAILREVDARKATFKDTVLKDVDARSIDLSDATLGELCDLSGAELEKAIMRRVKADRVSFVGANMERANLVQASLRNAVVEGVNLRFANLDRAVADGIKASDVDMTGAKLTDIQAKGAEFSRAQLEGIKANRADLSKSVFDAANLRGAKMSDAILKKVNLKKSDLRNADLARVDLKEADVDEAIINDGTDLNGAKIEGGKGAFEHESAYGARAPMQLEEVVDRSNQAQAARNRSRATKWLGKKARSLGGATKRVGAFIKQPISKKWGRIIGAVAGVALVATYVASTVLSAGLSIPITAAIIGGSVLASAGIGAVVGHYAAKKMGLSVLVGASSGFFAANALNKVKRGFSKVSGWFSSSKKPNQRISSKLGIAIGVTAGVAAAGVFIATTVLTAGLNIPIMAASITGSVLVGGGAGAILGDFAAKKTTPTVAASSGAGFMAVGAPGLMVGGAAAISANVVVETVFGQTVDEFIGGALNRAGERAQDFGDKIVRGEELLINQERSKDSYQALEFGGVNESRVNRVQEAAIRKAAIEASKMVQAPSKEASPSLSSQQHKKKARQQVKVQAKAMRSAIPGQVERAGAKSEVITPSVKSKSKGPEVG